MRGTSAARHILFTCLRASNVTKSILDRLYQDYPAHWTQYQIPWRKLDWIPDPWYLHDAPQVLHSDWISVLLLSQPRSAQTEGRTIYQGLWFLYMAQAEEKLSVQVGQVDGIQVNLCDQLCQEKDCIRWRFLWDCGDTAFWEVRIRCHPLLQAAHGCCQTTSSMATAVANAEFEPRKWFAKGACEIEPHKFEISQRKPKSMIFQRWHFSPEAKFSIACKALDTDYSTQAQSCLRHKKKLARAV